MASGTGISITADLSNGINVTINALSGIKATSRLYFFLLVTRNNQVLQYPMANTGHNQPGPQVPNSMIPPKIPVTYSFDKSNFLDEKTGAPYQYVSGDILNVQVVEKTGTAWDNGTFLGSAVTMNNGALVPNSKEGFSSGIPISFTIEPWWIVLAAVLLLFLVFHKEFSGCLASVSKSIGVSKILKNSRR